MVQKSYQTKPFMGRNKGLFWESNYQGHLSGWERGKEESKMAEKLSDFMTAGQGSGLIQAVWI